MYVYFFDNYSQHQKKYDIQCGLSTFFLTYRFLFAQTHATLLHPLEEEHCKEPVHYQVTVHTPSTV